MAKLVYQRLACPFEANPRLLILLLSFKVPLERDHATVTRCVCKTETEGHLFQDFLVVAYIQVLLISDCNGAERLARVVILQGLAALFSVVLRVSLVLSLRDLVLDHKVDGYNRLGDNFIAAFSLLLDLISLPVEPNRNAMEECCYICMHLRCEIFTNLIVEYDQVQVVLPYGVVPGDGDATGLVLGDRLAKLLVLD